MDQNWEAIYVRFKLLDDQEAAIKYFRENPTNPEMWRAIYELSYKDSPEYPTAASYFSGWIKALASDNRHHNSEEKFIGLKRAMKIYGNE